MAPTEVLSSLRSLAEGMAVGYMAWMVSQVFFKFLLGANVKACQDLAANADSKKIKHIFAMFNPATKRYKKCVFCVNIRTIFGISPLKRLVALFFNDSKNKSWKLFEPTGSRDSLPCHEVNRKFSSASSY